MGDLVPLGASSDARGRGTGAARAHGVRGRRVDRLKGPSWPAQATGPSAGPTDERPLGALRPVGFSIDAALASARALGSRIGTGASDLAITVVDPRDALRAWFTRRSDPRAFDIPESLGGVLAARYAASPNGTDRLHPALEMVFALDASRSEP